MFITASGFDDACKIGNIQGTCASSMQFPVVAPLISALTNNLLSAALKCSDYYFALQMLECTRKISQDDLDLDNTVVYMEAVIHVHINPGTLLLHFQYQSKILKNLFFS